MFNGYRRGYSDGHADGRREALGESQRLVVESHDIGLEAGYTAVLGMLENVTNPDELLEVIDELRTIVEG